MALFRRWQVGRTWMRGAALDAALAGFEIRVTDVDAVAVTAGPGLVGGPLGRSRSRQGLAAGIGVDLYGVNHTRSPGAVDEMMQGVAGSGHCAVGLRAVIRRSS